MLRRGPCRKCEPLSSPEPAAASATRRPSSSRMPAGASSPARGSPFRAASARGARGPEDHIEVDLSDPEGLAVTIEEMRKRLTDGRVHALVNNAAVSPKAGDGGPARACATRGSARGTMSCRSTSTRRWMLARGLARELAAGRGSVVNVTSIAGGRVHRFAGPAYATLESGAGSAHPARWRRSSAPTAFASTPSRRARSDTPMLSPGTDEIVRAIPVGRMGEPDEVARHDLLPLHKFLPPTSTAPKST